LYTTIHQLSAFPRFLGIDVKDDFFREDLKLKSIEIWKGCEPSGEICTCSSVELVLKKTELQSPSLFSSKTLWVVDELSLPGRKKYALDFIFSTTSCDQYFIFVGEGGSLPSQLVDDVQKRGLLLSGAPIKPWEKSSLVEAWVCSYVKKKQKRISSDAAHTLATAFSSDRGGLSQELDKLMLYKKDEATIALPDVEAICSIETKSTLWNVLDAVLLRDIKKIVETLSSLEECNDIALLRFMRNQIEKFLVAESSSTFKTKTQQKQYAQAQKIGQATLLSWIKAFEMHEMAIKSGEKSVSTDDLYLLFLNLHSMRMI
jgi:DNA polymerase III delta subunit